MYLGLFLSLITGWLIGGLSNWLADQLPHLAQRPLHLDQRRFLDSLSLPWSRRVDAEADAAHAWRRRLFPLAMAIAFTVGWVCFGGDPGKLVVGWFYTAWLLLVLVIDLEHRRVLNVMLPAAVLVALIAPLLTLLQWANLPTYTSALMGGGVGFLLFAFIFVIGRGRMMGAGDVKLAGVIGLMIGYPMVWAALALGIFLGGLAAIFIIIRYRAATKSYKAYGPYLALGALFILWFRWP